VQFFPRVFALHKSNRGKFSGKPDRKGEGRKMKRGTFAGINVFLILVGIMGVAFPNFAETTPMGNGAAISELSSLHLELPRGDLFAINSLDNTASVFTGGEKSVLIRPPKNPSGNLALPETFEEEEFAAQREEMIKTLREKYFRKNELVLKAMGKVRRHRFIPEPFRAIRSPYGDHSCPVREDQTISQPSIIAYMIETINPQPGQKILEITNGPGYQSAILAEMGVDLYRVGIIRELSEFSERVLREEGYSFHSKIGKGLEGWEEYAPYDAVIINCVPKVMPKKVISQLKDGGRMILPFQLKNGVQKILLIRRDGEDFLFAEGLTVQFVKMAEDQ